MNVGYGIAVIAGLLQLQEAPDMTNVVAMLQPYMPQAAYAGVVVVEDQLTYVGGLDWLIGSRWGVGAEYRHWPARIQFGGAEYKAVTHAAGGYLYRELPAWGRVTLRTEAGGAAVWTDSVLDTSSTWAVGVRAVGRVALSDRLSLVGWAGSLRVGSSEARDGKWRGTRGRTTLAETGIALRITAE